MQAILFAIGVVVALIIGAFSNFNLDGNVETILGATAAWFLALGVYLVSFWSLTEQTPGMRALGIEVTTAPPASACPCAARCCAWSAWCSRRCRCSPATS